MPNRISPPLGFQRYVAAITAWAMLAAGTHLGCGPFAGVAAKDRATLATPQNDPQPKEPEEARVAMPELALLTLEGRSARLAEHRGRVVLLNFWTTWCPPCRREIPELNELHREYRDAGLVILGVSPEETGVIERFLQVQTIDYPVLRLIEQPPHPVSEVFGSFPTTFIITRDGHIAHVFVGKPPKADMEAAFKPLL